MKAEVVHSIKLMETNKVPGPDGMYTETIQLLKEENLDIIVRSFNNILDKGQLPKDWLLSTYCPTKIITCKTLNRSPTDKSHEPLLETFLNNTTHKVIQEILVGGANLDLRKGSAQVKPSLTCKL